MQYIVKKIIKSAFAAFGYKLAPIKVAAYNKWGIDPIDDIKRISSSNDFKSLNRIDKIFDVGANIGQSLAKFSDIFPSAHIHAFEPVANTFEQLSSNVRSCPNISLHRMGFGKESGRKNIYTYQSSLLSSCVAHSPVMSISSTSYTGEVNVEIMTIDEFAQQHKIKKN